MLYFLCKHYIFSIHTLKYTVITHLSMRTEIARGLKNIRFHAKKRVTTESWIFFVEEGERRGRKGIASGHANIESYQSPKNRFTRHPSATHTKKWKIE